MNLSTQIKMLCMGRGKKLYTLLEPLTVSSQVSLTIKFRRNAWKASELFAVLDFLGYDLIIRDRKENSEIVITESYFDNDDDESSNDENMID